MNFSLLIDRAGSAFFSLISSMVVVGMIAIGFQLAYVPAKILTYNRYAQADNLEAESGLFPNPDKFTLGLFNMASKYAFSGKQAFSRVHPNLLREAYLNRQVLEPGSRQEAAANALSIKNNEVKQLNRPVLDVGGTAEMAAKPGEMLLAVPVSIRAGTTGKEDRGARDPDGATRFTMGQFRLLGYKNDEHYHAGVERYPIGVYRGESGGNLLGKKLLVNEAAMDEISAAFPNKTVEVTLLFSWPEDMKKLPPQMLEFKRSSRQAMPDWKSMVDQTN